MSDEVTKAFRASRLDRVRWYIAAWIIPSWMLRTLLGAVNDAMEATHADG